MSVDFKEIKRKTLELATLYLFSPSKSLKERIILFQIPIVRSNARKLLHKLAEGVTTIEDLVQYGLFGIIQDFDTAMVKLKRGDTRTYNPDKKSYWAMCDGLSLESDLPDSVQRKLRLHQSPKDMDLDLRLAKSFRQKRTFDDEHHGGRLDDLSLFEGEWSLLPNEYRDIMYFVHICDLEYRDAARRMGVSKSQAWLLGQKGRRLFQFLLDFDPESFQKAKENDFLLYLAGINGFNANELVLLSSIYGYEYKTINYVARQAGIERTTALAWAEGRFRVTTLPRGYHPLNFTPEPDKAIGSLRQRKGELRNTLDYVSGVTGEPYSTLKRWAKRGVFEIEDIGEGHIPRYVVVDKQAIAKIELEREILNNSLHKVAIMTGMDTRTLLKLSSQGLFKVYDRGERFSKGSAPRYYVDNIDEVVQVVAGR